MPSVDLPPPPPLSPPAIVRRCEKPICQPLALAAQLLPNLTLGVARHDATVGGRLRLTPILVAFGMVGGPRVRTLAVEPLERHAGSLELVAQGELYHRRDRPGIVRGLLVGTIGVRERGEQLSFSFGLGVASDLHRAALSVEAGVYTFSGILGLQVSYTALTRSPPVSITIVCKLF